MRPYILAETNWEILQNERFDLAVLPWGATEAQGAALAAEAAKHAWERGSKVIVLPTVPFGVNTGQPDIYLDINLNPTTQLAILSDIITVLDRQKLYKLLIFNSHGGNNFKALVRELGLKFPEMFISVSNWTKVVDKMDYFDKDGDHADEMETSLMLYLKPELVLPKEKWGSGESKKHKIKGFSEGWVWAERKWSQISKDTGVGNPEFSTKEKGKRFFKDVTEKMGELFIELCEADIDDLYR